MFLVGGIFSQIGISLLMAIIFTAIVMIAMLFAVAPLSAIDNDIVQAIAGLLLFGVPILTFIVVFILSLTTDYS
ncbi:hypothetical protein [Staphylococcus xylosus]|uniref:hypothetical protein n=1 Tax=Staphylococcus xylosus TaxID=1288 RepID=UPI003CF97F04